MNNSKRPMSRIMQRWQPSLPQLLPHHLCTKMFLQHTLTPTSNAAAVDTVIPEATALLLAKSASTVAILDILQHYAEGPEAQGSPSTDRESHTPLRRSNSHRCKSCFLSRDRQSCQSTSCSSSITCTQQCRSPHWLNRSWRSPTPYRHEVSHVSLTTSHPSHVEGRLFTDTASDGHTLFHTTLQIVTSQGSKHLQVKVNPELISAPFPLTATENFTKHLTKVGHLKQNELYPMLIYLDFTWPHP